MTLRMTAMVAAAAMIATPLAMRAAAAAMPGPVPASLHGSVAGTVLQVTGAPGHNGSGRVIFPLEVQLHGHGVAGDLQAAGSTPAGYSPAQLRVYLGLHGSGLGQDVAIVDAFDDPYVTSDVNTFSRQFHLPLACGTPGAGSGCFPFAVTHPYGIGGIDTGWGLEASLDVEMVHAIAPRAAITLVEAYDNAVGSLFAAVDFAAAKHPAAISNSWGVDVPEFTGERRYDWHCQVADSLCVFSTGDGGYPGQYPSYNPAVLAVGGTTLRLSARGQVTSEQAWSSGGGGLSEIEPRPAYQAKVDHSRYRGTPDVSFDANPATGVPVYDTEINGGTGNGHWFEVGGTSVGAPAWSAILAVADQLRGQQGKGPLTEKDYLVQRAVYSVRYGHGLYDITKGSNGPVYLCGKQCAAGPGYDYVTGLGSPRPGIDRALANAR